MCRVSFIWVCRLPNPYARDVPCVIGLACPNDPNGVLQQAKVIRRLWGNLDIRKFARECSKILRTILNMCVLSPDPFRNCVNFPPLGTAWIFVVARLFWHRWKWPSATLGPFHPWPGRLSCRMLQTWPAYGAYIRIHIQHTHTYIYIHTHRIHVWYIC